MATKKKAVAAPVDAPSVLLADESNKTVARAKAALAKKWSMTRIESLLDTAQLAWFFVALGRAAEASALAECVCEGVVFSGDPNVWSPAASSIALAARLARLGGDEARRAILVARLVEHPAVPSMPREAFVKWVADANKDVRSAEVDPSQKWALQGFARGCARAAYVREMAAAGGFEPGTIDVDALEHTIDEGLAGLRAHLAR